MGKIKIYGPTLAEPGLATINVASTASRFERINADNTLSFEIAVKKAAASYINDANVVGLDGDFFDIARYTKKQPEKGLRIASVECEHVSYRLNEAAYNLDYFTQTGTPTAILTELLDGTGFTVGTVEFTESTTYSAQEAKSRRALVMEFVAILGGEVEFFGFAVSIHVHRGVAIPQVLLVGRDVIVLSKTVNKRVLASAGVPAVSYACGVYKPDNLALGDAVTLNEDNLDIDVTLRIVSITYDPYNPAHMSIEVGNYTNALENDLYRIETSSLVKGKTYFGTRISPEFGFESIRSDKLARTVMNADTFAMQSGDGSGSSWTNKLYFDPATGMYIFDGTLSATTIEALKAEIDVVISNTVIVNNLTAQKGYIAELTVDQIDTSDMVVRYLLPSSDPLRLAPIGYWRGRDQFIEFFDAQIPNPLSLTEVQVTGRTGNLLYWLDAASVGTGITETVTAFPVMRFVYNGPDGIGLVKLSIFHRYDSLTGYYNPLIKLGAGSGVGDNATATIEKKIDGLYLTYTATGSGARSAGEEVSIALTNDGVFITPYDLESVVFSATGFSVTYSGDTLAWTWIKDVNGKITQLSIDGRTIPVTWP